MTATTNKSPFFFSTPAAFRLWLEKYGQIETEIWVGFYKKNSGKTGMNYDQALDEALCFGWIDGLVNKHDESSYKQRFTPRRAKSIWSRRNTEHIERLIRERKMAPAGLTEVAAAKKDGRWQQAYDSSQNSTIPDDFLQQLQAHPQAKEFFSTLNKSNLYAISYRLQTAKKPETRQKRITDIIIKLSRKEKFH